MFVVVLYGCSKNNSSVLFILDSWAKYEKFLAGLNFFLLLLNSPKFNPMGKMKVVGFPPLEARTKDGSWYLIVSYLSHFASM